MKIFYLLIILMHCFVANAQVRWPEVNGGVRVLDETGKPITNAQIRVWFDSLKTSNAFDGTKTEGISGQPDSNGQFAATHTAIGEFGVKVEKDGYYLGRARVNLDKHNDNQWIPWHQVIELKLRARVAPVAMCAKRLESLVLPVVGNPIGYDLLAGDWIAPHGKGVVSDLVFLFQREFHGRLDFNWQLSVQLLGDGNGLQTITPGEETPQSELRFPRTAPADGYALNAMYSAIKQSTSGRSETNSTSATNFFFRVRAEYDENKHLKSALYGRLLGPVRVNVQGTKTAKLFFTYYLNPTPLDRNMEFDPKKNLFKGLRFEEEVREP